MGDLKARQQKVAILYQAGPTPSQGGIRKPPKPGGYRDSGADIAYALKIRGVVVLTPHPDPDPATDQDWVFGDDAPGIRAALDAGATMRSQARLRSWRARPWHTLTNISNSGEDE